MRHARSRVLASIVVVLIGLLPAVASGLSAVDDADVKVTNDNNNVDGGTPNPSFDAQNRQANETTIAINPVNPDIVAAGANDYAMVPVTGDGWLGFYVSADGGTNWFNTMVPGFPTDTSPAGLASPLLGLDGAGDPVVRFDGDGNLYVGGISFNRDFDRQDLARDTVAFVARYDYTPGTPGGVSTPNSAASPPNYTYAYTTIVGKGAVGFAIPEGQPFGSAGLFPDKNWMGVDINADSPCYGNVYYTFTHFAGLGGSFPIVFARSTDGGATFSQPSNVSSSGKTGTNATQGSNIAVGSDGTVYVSYRTFPTSSDPTTQVQVVASHDCGRHFAKPVTAAVIVPMLRQEPDLTFRTPLESWIAVDDTNPSVVYVAFAAKPGGQTHGDVFVAGSTDGGLTWGSPVKANDDGGTRHQFWPAIAVSNGVLHVVWYDLRNSTTAGNEALDVYYANSTNHGLTFDANVRVTDVSHNANCRMFGGGTSGFHGDYIELAVYYDSDAGEHFVHIAWTDNRDVNPCDLDPAVGPDSNNTGNRNQNIYADTLVVSGS
jgi:hypothetical protein